MKIVYVGLGGNIQNPLQQIKTALHEVAELPQTQLLKQSSLYQTKPVGYLLQPDFINAVVELRTTLEPNELLTQLQRLEQKHSRNRSQEQQRNAPRTLDLDILLYENIEISTPQLTIPHPRLTKRAFVLYPLAEIAPHLLLPNGVSVQYYLQQVSANGIQRLT